MIDKFHSGDEITFLLVSVLDVDINLEVSEEELFNKEIWEEGWLNLTRMKDVFDCDHIIVNPSVKVLKKLNRLHWVLEHQKKLLYTNLN